MNFTIPPPFSSPCICPIETGISCVKWTSSEWIITSSLLSSLAGAIITALAVYVRKNRVLSERPRMRTNLNTIDENDSIPQIAVNTV